MCGRYTLSTKDFSKHYGVEQGAFEFSPSYNIAPTQTVPVVLEQEGTRTVQAAQWGMLPSWILLANSVRYIDHKIFRVAKSKLRCTCASMRRPRVVKPP